MYLLHIPTYKFRKQLSVISDVMLFGNCAYKSLLLKQEIIIHKKKLYLNPITINFKLYNEI